jgi:peptidoglycan/LPS O-acetylase OafA/YrhL
MLGQTSPISVRFEALDALLVVLFHIPIYHVLKDVGWFANLQFCVDMFFALSAFVLCHACTPSSVTKAKFVNSTAGVTRR